MGRNTNRWMMDILNDRYQIQQQLGKKAGRQTFLAQDLQTQTAVVVKVLSFGDAFDWDDLKLFEREAATLQSLSHPAIPNYLDYFELEAKGFALVQSYIDAQSLEQHLKAGRTFSEAEVKQLAKELLGILAFLHDRQPPVIHRDIKPSNILLTNRSGNSPGQVYLVDFGSVQTLAAKEGGTITVVGTYGYMPPEQFGGRATPASDLYSLGATLIYLATGRHPADLPQDDLRIEFEDVAEQLSESFRRWLRRLTEPSLKHRFTSVHQALQALDNPHSSSEQPSFKLSKPANSRIRLKTTTDTFDVLLPPVGIRALTTPATVISVLISVFFLIFLGIPIDFEFKILFFLLTSIVWFYGGALIAKTLKQLFRYRRLRIDQNHITLTSEIFGLRLRKHIPTHRQDILRLKHSRLIQAALERTTYRSDISKVVYIPGHWARDTQGRRVNIPPQISIWAKNWVYEITPLDLGIETDEEMAWLAQELSQWLGLPVDRT